MKEKTAFYLALKLLSTLRRRFPWPSFYSLVAIGGIVVSVAAFIVIEGVISGNRLDMRNKILGFSAHVNITLEAMSQLQQDAMLGKLRSDAEVQHVFTYIEGEAFLKTQQGDQEAVRVRALDQKQLHPEIELTFWPERSWKDFAESEKQLPGALVGSAMEEDFHFLPYFSEKLTLIFPLGELGPSGDFEPTLRSYKIIGKLKTGYYEYDRQLVLIDYRQGKLLFGENYPVKFAVYLKNPDHVEVFAKKWSSQDGVKLLSHWKAENARLFSALILERYGMSIILAFMLLLSALNIISILWLIGQRQKRGMALLMALGLTPSQVSGVLLRAGILLGLSGVLFGVGVGVGLAFVLRSLGQWVKLLSLPYYLDSLPVTLNVWFILVVAIIAFVLSLLASVIPARRVHRLEIAATLSRLNE